MRKSVVVHVITTKGKGYKPAENDPSRFHGTDSFNIEDGSSNNNSNTEISYSEAISNELYNLQKEVKTYVVMPAMTVGSKFRKFQIDYQDRYLDVGIAEEHAATLAGSLSLNKMKVILSFYAVFSQRAFDQILNEIARPNHHVVILLDRAGLVSEDGSTHQGIYDIPMFNMMPNMVILSPYSISEVKAMVRYAVLKCDTPVVIRYPKASLINNCTDDNIEFDSKWKFIIKENDSKICIISYGECLNYLNEIILDNDLNISLVNARIVKPIDADFLEMLFLEYKHIVVYEETVLEGSLYSVICTYGAKTKIYGMNITNKVIPHGALEDLRKYCGLDSKKVIELVNKIKEEAC